MGAGGITTGVDTGAADTVVVATEAGTGAGAETTGVVGTIVVGAIAGVCP